MCTMWMRPKLVQTWGWYLSIRPHIQNFHLKKLQSKVCIACVHLAALPNLNWFTGYMALSVWFTSISLLIYISLQHTVSSLQWKGGLRSSIILTLSSVVRSDLITSLEDKINIEFTELRVMTWPSHCVAKESNAILCKTMLSSDFRNPTHWFRIIKNRNVLPYHHSRLC